MTLAPNVYEFDGYHLDLAALELRDPNGQVVDLSPTALELLAYLLRNRERVVSKAELFEHLWPDVVVNENALAQCVWAARKAVGDAGNAQRVIKNVRGRGYRLVAEVSTAGPAPAVSAVSRSEPPPHALDDVVGREEDLSRLDDDLQRALSGTGHIRLLSGEAGIGKTCLLQALVSRAESRGLTALSGRCYEDEGMPPYWPWKQALGGFVKRADDEALRACVASDAADLARLVPSLHQRLGQVPRAPEREVDDDRYYLFQAVTDFLHRAARHTPLVIALDDIHWADLPSLQLLKFLAPAISRAGIVVVVTYRGEEISDDHRTVLQAVERQSSTTSSSLGGLSADAVGEVLRRAGRSAAAPVAERVTHLTAGNPFFVMQFARLAAETGAIEEKDVESLELPGALQRILAERLRKLPDEARTTLRLAAIIGQQFALSDIRRVSREDPSATLRSLDTLVGQRIVQRDPSHLETYRFIHPLMREAVYRNISEPDRAALHRTVAEAIETAYAGYPMARLDELAHHYYAAAPAGSAAKAVLYTELAARRAFEAAAFEEAARQYRRALEAVDAQDAPDETKRSQLLLGLGHALRGAREPVERVRAAFSQVAERAASMSDADLFADAALAYAGHGPLRLGHLTEMGTVDKTEVALLEKASQMLGAGDSPKKALVLSWLGRALYHSGDTKRRGDAAREAVVMARRLEEPRLVTVTLLLKQQILRTPHCLPERMADLTEAVELAQSMGARELELDARHERAWAYVELARIEEAERDIGIVARIAEELQDPGEKRVVENWELVRAYLQENVDVVEARDHQRYMKRRNPQTGQAYSVRLLMARYSQGRAEESLALLEGYAKQFPLPVSWQSALASTYATVGRMDDARRVFEELAQGGFSTVPMTHDWVPSYVLLANACQLLEDTARARTLLDILAPFEGNIVVHGVGRFIGGIVARTLADLHRVLGNYDEAERCYGIGLDISERLRSPIHIAWNHVDYAKVLLLRDAPGDRKRAAELLEEAHPVIEEMGLGLLKKHEEALRERYDLPFLGKRGGLRVIGE